MYQVTTKLLYNKEWINWLQVWLNGENITLLKRISYLLPLETRITLYNSLVRPLFDYGDPIWGDKGNATLMNDLQLLQNKAA